MSLSIRHDMHTCTIQLTHMYAIYNSTYTHVCIDIDTDMFMYTHIDVYICVFICLYGNIQLTHIQVESVQDMLYIHTYIYIYALIYIDVTMGI